MSNNQNGLVLEAAKLLQDFEKAALDRICQRITPTNNKIHFEGFSYYDGRNLGQDSVSYRVFLILNDEKIEVSNTVKVDMVLTTEHVRDTIFKDMFEKVREVFYDCLTVDFNNFLPETKRNNPVTL